MTLVKIFSAILKMSLTASVVILVVCAARLAMKRAPKIYSYLLWALVLFRLLCPIALFTSVSVVPSEVSSGAAISDWEADYIEEVQVHYNGSAEYEAAVSAGRAPVSDVAVSDRSEAPSEGETVHYDGGTEQESAAGTEKPSDDRSYVITGKDGISEPKTVKNTVMPLLACVWIAGVLALLIPGMISYIRIKRKTQVVIPLRKNMYIGDDVESPFVMGIFRPVIYLPGTLDTSEREYIIAHESHHIRRGDHIFKALGFLALTLHWFNPLVWLAFALAVRDMEMSCDEAVIRKLGEDVRAEYSASLLKLATGHRLFAGSPLAFGENDPAGRVRNLSKWKKPAIWVIILCLVVCAVLAVVLLTDLNTDPSEKQDDEIHETTENTTEASQERFFTLDDFSSLVIHQSTYADICNLVPQDRQPDLIKFPFGLLGSYCDYPTEGGGFIRILFVREDLVITDIEFYPVREATFTQKENGNIVSENGTEYAFWAMEGTQYDKGEIGEIGELQFAGGIQGEPEISWIMGLPTQLGMYRIKNRESDDILIRYIEDNEWYAIYRKITLVQLEESTDNTAVQQLPLSELPELYSAEQAMIDGCFVQINGVATDNKEIFHKFASDSRAGIHSYIRIINWYIGDKSHYTAMDLSFNGSVYTVTWLENGKEYSRQYRYLVHFTGEKEQENIDYDAYEHYVLLNDKQVSWKEIWHSLISSQRPGGIEHMTVYSDYIYYPEFVTIPETIAKAELVFEGNTLITVTERLQLTQIRQLFHNRQFLGYEPKNSIGVGLNLILTDQSEKAITIELDPNHDVCRINGEYVFYGAFDEPSYVEKLWDYLNISQWPEQIYQKYPKARENNNT